ncbi:unnamed protein product [Oikopleura dioica]|uniref:PDZ domain-containing protein n=1 Tax=Oikopleura dioica TaxID=34765 RepID=E4YSK9_OIKDI|nr:unnamed protein product [Oikopleura dioica]
MSDDPREEQPYESSNFELNAAKNVINANRRTGRWKKLEVEVFKGTSGLGFTLASRDTTLSSTRGETPMIVNRILPGSAAQSSDLQIGDKLLTINGDNISSLSQSQVVKLLKACPSGGPVLLGVSRQLRKERKSPEEETDEEDRFTVNSKVLEMFKGATEVCSFNISMENTSLGIQLKGTQQNNSSLSGLFVDKILTTGAAFKDGRIKENDRILAINNHSLHGYDNETALEIIRQNLNSISRSEVYIKVERPKTAVKKSLSYPNSFVISKPHSPRKTDSLPRQFNDSYIMATQHGIRTFSLDSGKSGINRSQSLHECNSSQNKQINKCDSISYIECSIDSEESDSLAFERESSMRKSFHENRKQSNSPPAKFFNMYDAYRKKKNEQFDYNPKCKILLLYIFYCNHSPRSRSIERNRRATEGNKVHKRYQTHSSPSPTSSLQSSRRSSSSSRGRESSSENYGRQNGFEKSQLLRRSASSDRANLSRASTSGISSLGASNSARSSPLAPCSYDPVRERPQPRDRPTGQQQQSGRHFYAHFSEEDRRRYDQIRKATVDMGRKKVESQEKINNESRNGNDAPNLRALSGKYLPVVADTCRDPKYPTIGRVKMSNRYRSPGTISCQDFRPHQPTSARPFFTPGASTPKSAEAKRSNSVNRRIDYDAVPRSLGSSISRSKVI